MICLLWTTKIAHFFKSTWLEILLLMTSISEIILMMNLPCQPPKNSEVLVHWTFLMIGYESAGSINSGHCSLSYNCFSSFSFLPDGNLWPPPFEQFSRTYEHNEFERFYSLISVTIRQQDSLTSATSLYLYASYEIHKFWHFMQKKNVYLGAINKLGFQSKKLRIFIYFYLHLLNDCQLWH